MKFSAAVTLLIFVCSFMVFAEVLPEEHKLQSLKKEIEENREKLQLTKEQQEEVLGKLVVITKELKKSERSLNLAQNKIKTNENQIKVLGSELKETESELMTKQDKLKARIKEVYKNSGLNYLDLLVFSRSMSDFLSRLYFFNKIINYDAKLVMGIRADAQKVKVNREMLRNRTEEIKVLAKDIREKKEKIAVQAEEKKKVYKDLEQREKEYEAKITEMEKSSKELEAMILTKVAGRRAKALGSGILEWPVRGRLTSLFGARRRAYSGRVHYHTGLDIATKYGTPIGAADAGEVIFAGWWDGYGKAIVIDHGHSITTVYGHMSRIFKAAGDIVVKGQVIGLIGSTGNSTGPHLHFEVRKKGQPVNPMNYLK